MFIKNKVAKSAAFQNLFKIANAPIKDKKGVVCTAIRTTVDTQKVIINLLDKHLKSSFIYSPISTRSICRYLQSCNIFTQQINYSSATTLLEKYGFTKVDKITSFSEYRIKGDTISFWLSSYDHPIRLNFFGDDVESIIIYDEIYNTRIKNLKEVVIGNESLLEDEIEKQAVKLSSYKGRIKLFILLFEKAKIKNYQQINFSFSYPQLYFNRVDLLKKEILRKEKEGWEIGISTNHQKKLPKELQKFAIKDRYESGFESKKLKTVVYSDREIFGTIFISTEKSKSKKQVNRYLAQLEGEIDIEEYIVHEDYGIAIYKGITQRNVLGKKMDYLILEYAEGDKLSVPISQIHKLTKYIGPSNTPPKITRLGKTNWHTIKRKVKESIYKVAKELLKHYAKSELAKGFKYPAHEWEDKFASEFEYEETEDQKRAIVEILDDMQSTKPMNRILVGDVGFGKTEVAIRAAFRSVMNGKQVAILCPTTILVSQHFSVFKHRMREYPIIISTLSRFGTKVENKRIVNDLNNGKVDIIIGTHRLLSNDIAFKKLGLLIIDEEQKFGVKQKEKIKKLAYSSDVLYMSATPIPRTLSMALSRLRDISIITTPPPGRKMIGTKVEKFDIRKVVNAILREVNRSGQVYLVHNEIRTINTIEIKLKRLLPQVRFKIAHGQMHPQTLDKVMRNFYKHKFDCLICTTIIENGIDIKNVNTIIINKAERFGLSQLYQLRGRVGRGTRQAYANLFFSQKDKLLDKPKSGKQKKISFSKAKARLEAILESQELGSGFKIASRDLEIRGAGNLLGKAQHGSISKIGLGLYTQLLSSEIERIRKTST